MAYFKHEWINGEMITAEKLNCIERGIDCVANCSELWINPQPVEKFGAQVLAIDSSTFKIIEFYFITESGDGWQNIAISVNKNRMYKDVDAWRFMVKFGNYERYITITDAQIEFSDCKYGINYNDKLIPYCIHGFE